MEILPREISIGEFAVFKMNIGFYEKALPAKLSWKERLAVVGQAGYDFIEISIEESDERISRLDWPVSERAALRQAIANTGVKVMTMCLSGHRMDTAEDPVVSVAVAKRFVDRLVNEAWFARCPE